jgi:hypothetical protein
MKDIWITKCCGEEKILDQDGHKKVSQKLRPGDICMKCRRYAFLIRKSSKEKKCT